MKYKIQRKMFLKKCKIIFTFHIEGKILQHAMEADSSETNILSVNIYFFYKDEKYDIRNI